MEGSVWAACGGASPPWRREPDGVRTLAADVRIGEDDAVLAFGGATRGIGQARTIGAWVWNARETDIEALPLREIERRLRREGFSASLEPRRTPDGGRRQAGSAGKGRLFEVAVFGLAAAAVRPSTVGFPRSEQLERRLKRSSARALYVLGLDMGMVKWKLDRTGRTGMIVGLSPSLTPRSPGEEDWLREAAAAFAADWRRETSAGVSATIGADPEFVLLTPGGKVVPASRYFPPHAAAGADSAIVGGVLRWPLAELRPAPAAEPRLVAARLRGLLAAAARRTAGAPPLRWLAGAAPVRGLPLGGHLHLSGAALTGERLRALDNAVALPLRLLEPPDAHRRRPRYGALGDFRPKAHGGFEYRTPPSWLVSPTLARGALALAKVAAEHSRRLAAHRPLDDDAMRDAFYGGDRERLLAGAADVYRALQATPGYAKYRADIDPLFRAIREGRRWDEGADIRRKWRIEY